MAIHCVRCAAVQYRCSTRGSVDVLEEEKRPVWANMLFDNDRIACMQLRHDHHANAHFHGELSWRGSTHAFQLRVR